MKYRAEIDGLRAVAVLAVVLFHAEITLFQGGFVGVDVFFVISGYLITTIIIQDIERKRFSLIDFYERRARRILPALFLIMLVCIPFAWGWFFNQQIREFGLSLIATSFFASNILFWRQSDYFAAAAEEKPLLHTCSLDVEEQYYLLFPIFIIFLWRFGKKKLFWIIAFVAVISLALSDWSSRQFPTANFYLAPTRAWELFGGAIAALVMKKRVVPSSNIFSFLGVAFVLGAIFFYNDAIPFPGVYALVPVIGSLFLILFAHGETLVARLLSTKIFVGVGLISYSAYLWHQPIFAFSKLRNFGQELSTEAVVGLTILTIGLSYLTWRYIETPVRQRQFLTSRKAILFFSVFGVFAFSIVGFLMLHAFKPGENRNPLFINKFVGSSEYVADNFFLITESWALQKQVTGLPYFTVDHVPKDRELLFDLADSRRRMLIVGNSHSVDLFNVLFFQRGFRSQSSWRGLVRK